MDKISTDAQKFFKEESDRREYPIKIQHLEGSEGIQQGIVKLLEEASLLQARRVVLPFSRWAGFDLWPIIERWIDMRTKSPQQQTTADKKE